MKCKKCNTALQNLDVVCPCCGKVIDNLKVSESVLTKQNEITNSDKCVNKKEKIRFLKKVKDFEDENPELEKQKREEGRKRIKIIATVVLCVMILSAVNLMLTRGVIYFYANDDNGKISMTTLRATVFSGEDVKILSTHLGMKVTQIDPDAFRNTSVERVYISNGVTRIGFNSFFDCDSLTYVQIPRSVTSIEYNAFYDCDMLTRIEIPSSVTRLDKGAFCDCDSLVSIVIPNSVTKLGGLPPYSADKIRGGIFENCDSLISITIPKSVTSFGDSIFSNCVSLTNINYQGTMKEWKAISKGYAWDSNTGNYIVYCIDGTISK